MQTKGDERRLRSGAQPTVNIAGLGRLVLPQKLGLNYHKNCVFFGSLSLNTFVSSNMVKLIAKVSLTESNIMRLTTLYGKLGISYIGELGLLKLGLETDSDKESKHIRLH